MNPDDWRDGVGDAGLEQPVRDLLEDWYCEARDTVEFGRNFPHVDEKWPTQLAGRHVEHIPALLHALREGNIHEAVFRALWVGRIEGQLSILPDEIVNRRKAGRARAARAAGGRGRLGTRKVSDAKLAAALDAKLKAKPHLSKTQAARLIARSFGVSPRTMLRAWERISDKS